MDRNGRDDNWNLRSDSRAVRTCCPSFLRCSVSRGRSGAMDLMTTTQWVLGVTEYLTAVWNRVSSREPALPQASNHSATTILIMKNKSLFYCKTYCLSFACQKQEKNVAIVAYYQFYRIDTLQFRHWWTDIRLRLFGVFGLVQVLHITTRSCVIVAVCLSVILWEG